MIKKLFVSLFLLSFLGLIVYSFILLSTPYYNYYVFESDLEELLNISISERPEEVMTEIMNLAVKYNIPIEQENLTLKKNGRYTAIIFWEETVNFFTVYEKTFEFHIHTGQQISTS